MPSYAITPSKYLLPQEQAHLKRLLYKYWDSDKRNTTMLLMMLQTGARPQELLNITWADVDFESSSVFINTLKGGPPRVVPLSDDTITRLGHLREAGAGGRVFNIKYNTFRDIWAHYRPVKKKLHSLRHTFAVNLYKRSGYNLRLVQQALGHANIQTTSAYLQIEASLDQLRAFID